ncbi:hypothetical protein AHAS_Ahas03G0163600 [Arachis hypogaea]
MGHFVSFSLHMLKSSNGDQNPTKKAIVGQVDELTLRFGGEIHWNVIEKCVGEVKEQQKEVVEEGVVLEVDCTTEETVGEGVRDGALAD